MLVEVPGTAQSDAPAVAGKRGVLLIAVGESVVGALGTTADGELLIDVVFDTCQKLVRAVFELFLAVVGHAGILVVEEVVFERGAQLGSELIASSYREQGGHIVARVRPVLIGCGIGAKLLLQCCQFRGCVLWVGRHHKFHHLLAQSGIQNIRFVLGVELGAELIAGGERERPLVVGQADDRREAPAFLVDIEQQLGDIAEHRMLYGLDVSAIVAVVIVDTHAYRCRQAVEDAVGEVDLSAIDILLALHLGIELVLVGCDAVVGKHAREQHVEHGHSRLVFHESAAAHNAYHGGEGPAVFLVSGKEGWYDGCRGLALVLLFASRSDGLDVAILPGFLEVE